MNHILKAAAAGVVTGTIIFATVAMIDPSADENTYAAPATVGAQAVYGNPAAGAKWWFAQTGPDCVEATASILIAEKAGKQPSDAAIDAEAEHLGVYTAGVGSTLQNLPSLYSHYGVPVTVGAHSLATLERDLSAGHGVVAIVNGETIWAADGFGLNVPSNVPDHAVVVDSVEGSYVTLTDTGINIPMARTETVSLATFDKAWGTSGYTLVVTK